MADDGKLAGPPLVSWGQALARIEEAWHRIGRHPSVEQSAAELFDRIRLWALDPVGAPDDVEAVRAYAREGIHRELYEEPSALGRVHFAVSQLAGPADTPASSAASMSAPEQADDNAKHPAEHWSEVIGFVCQQYYMHNDIHTAKELAQALINASRHLRDVRLTSRRPMSERSAYRIAAGWILGREAWERRHASGNSTDGSS